MKEVLNLIGCKNAKLFTDNRTNNILDSETLTEAQKLELIEDVIDNYKSIIDELLGDV